MTREAPATLVFLTGFMGAGKTAVGRALAGELHWEFKDLDEMVEAAAGKSVAAIFSSGACAADGEREFRRLESDALGELMATERSQPPGQGGTVVALGGGTLHQPENRETIQRSGARTVFLCAASDVLFERCRGDKATRPLYSDMDKFSAIYEQRQVVYRESTVTVQTAGKSPQQVAAEITQRLQLITAWTEGER